MCTEIAPPLSMPYTAENALKTVTGIATLNHGPRDRLIEVGAATAARFNYDGQMVIAEHNSSNVLQRRYVHGPGVDGPLVWYEGAGTGDRVICDTENGCQQHK